jgi:Tol biopolymer transport system component
VRYPAAWIAIALMAAGAPGTRCQQPGVSEGSIGFTGTDGNLYVQRAGEPGPRAITTDAGPERAYRQLTWSPDGARVAYLRYSSDESVSMFTALADGSEARRIYSSPEGAPFYLYWTPGGEEISFLETVHTRRDLTLKIVSWRGGDPLVVGTGQPYYWDWMSDGRTLVTHTGASAAENPDAAAISVVEHDGRVFRERARGPAPAFFQAPDASPDGRTFAAAVFAPQGEQVLVRLAPQPGLMLALVNTNGGVVRRLAGLEGVAAFAWSPQGTRIAFVDGSTTPLGGIVGPLALVDAQEPAAPRPTGLQQVVCFSWSPDGRRIAAFVPRLVGSPEPELLLAVFFVDAATAAATPAAVVRPTPEFLTGIVPFYDQYLRSSTMWSPDGTRLVLDAIGDDGRPGVYVLAVDSPGELRRLAQGVLPSWSPR